MPNIIKTYICPSNPLPSLGVFIPTGNTSGNNLTNYMGIVGRERKDWRFPTSTPLSGLGEDSGVMAVVVATTASPFSKPIKVGFASVTDGLSNTLASASDRRYRTWTGAGACEEIQTSTA